MPLSLMAMAHPQHDHTRSEAEAVGEFGIRSSEFGFRISDLQSASGRRVAPSPAGGSWPPPSDEA